MSDGPWTITCGECVWRAETATYRSSVSAYRRHMRWWHPRIALARYLRLTRGLLGLRYLE